MWGRELLNPQLPGSTAGERAELTWQQSAVHSHVPRACRDRRGFPQESQQLAFAACPSRPDSFLRKIAGALQSAHQLGLQLAFLCRLQLAQLQAKLLSPPESAGKTHRAVRIAPAPSILPTTSATAIPAAIRSTLLLEPTLPTRAKPTGGKLRSQF